MLSIKIMNNTLHSENLAIHMICFFELQDDVFLICSNAMQYNAPDTIYFRQVCKQSFFLKKIIMLVIP